MTVEFRILKNVNNLSFCYKFFPKKEKASSFWKICSIFITNLKSKA